MLVKQMLLAALCSCFVMSATEPIGVRTAVLGSDASVSQYLVVLPHIAYGGAWRTQIVIGNTSSTAADVTIYYYRSDGTPLSLAIAGVLADHTTLTIPAYGSRTVEPDWQDAATTAGWAGLVYSNSGLKIQGVFLWHNAAEPADKYIEATAPIISQAKTTCIIPLPSGDSSLSMPFDETQGRVSGYGFANTTNAPVTMNLMFYDQDGQMISQYSEQLAAFGHDHFLVKDRVQSLANRKGTMQVNGQGIAPLGFRFTPYGTFTTWLP